MTTLSQNNRSVQHINEVTHDIDPNTASISWTQHNTEPHTKCKTQNKPLSKIKTA